MCVKWISFSRRLMVQLLNKMTLERENNETASLLFSALRSLDRLFDMDYCGFFG